MAESNVRNKDRLSSELQAALTKSLDPQRAPDRFDEALEDVCSPDSDGTLAKCLINEGFQAWFAYFLTAERHSEFEIIAEGLDHRALKDVATEVCRVDPHDSVFRLFWHLFHHSNRKAKRCRLLASIDVRLPMITTGPQRSKETQQLASSSSKRHCGPDRQEQLELAVLGSYSMNPELSFLNGTTHAGSDASRQDDSDLASYGLQHTNTIDNQNGFTWPKARYLPYVFPTNMCSAILKNNGHASITITFPADPNQCKLFIDISATQVPHFASRLFDVHINTRDGQRTMTLENGVAVEINSGMRLKGATDGAIGKVLGNTIAAALRNHPRRLVELDDGALLTQCLWMDIPANAEAHGSLGLLVDAEYATPITQNLWQ